MIREYFNQKAALWDETIAEKDIVKLELMASRLNIAPGSALLDVGVGTGVFIPFLLNKVGRNGKIVALDFASEMLKKARAKNFIGNIKYLCCDVTDIPLVDEIFDAVVCYSSFPHFRDKLRALTEIKRVMKTNGELFVCHTSSRATINSIHRNIPAACNDTIPDEDEMRALLLKTAFKDIKIADEAESYLCCAKKPGLE